MQRMAMRQLCSRIGAPSGQANQAKLQGRRLSIHEGTKSSNCVLSADHLIDHATLTVKVRKVCVPRNRIGMSTWDEQLKLALGTA